MRLGLVLAEVGQGFRRNLSMVVSVVLVTFISLTFFGAAILLQMQIGQMKGYWYDRAQVAVYLCTDISLTPGCDETDASTDQIAAVKKALTTGTLASYVKTATFEIAQAGVRRTSSRSSRARPSSTSRRPTRCRSRSA